MHKDKRKNKRKPIRYTAWLAVENSPLHGCVVADISDSGAKLDVENSENLPDKFVLLLSRRTSLRRLCRAVWRTRTQIGVHFEKGFAEPLHEAPPLVPHMEAVAIAESEALAAEPGAQI
jgi:hypothetical protein